MSTNEASMAEYGVIFDQIRIQIPLDVEIDDPHTADAKRVNEVHRALYGRHSAHMPVELRS